MKTYWYFGYIWLKKPKVILSTYRKPSCLFASKKSTTPPCFIGDISNICKLPILGTLVMPGCTHPPTMLVSTSTRLQCLSSCQKTNFIIHFFLEMLHFNKSWNFIFWQHWELQFCQIWDWWWNNNKIIFHFRLFPRKTNDNFLKKSQKKPYFGAILDPFYPNLGKKWIFPQKRALASF